MRKLLTAPLALMTMLTAAQAQSIDPSASEVKPLIEMFQADRGALDRTYALSLAESKSARYSKFYADYAARLKKQPFETFSQEGKIDYILFKNYLEHEVRQIALRAKKRKEIDFLIPFAKPIVEFSESRRLMSGVKPQESAEILNKLSGDIAKAQKAAEAGIKVEKTVANRAFQAVYELKGALAEWFNFFNGYDPLFSWWTSEPYKAVDKALDAYAHVIREKLVGISADDKTTIIGDPIGEEALLSELQYEMIPYTPEEIIALANKEFAWCEAEMKKASHELGYGDDWKKALEHVKRDFVEPGKQPEMIREMALEAIKFVEDRDLVTVPELAKETWRMTMMSPQQQLVSPFFLGGEVIQVSFPTNTMGHEQKMMSLRGNNKHFARATVFHELIPGHHLQGFMQERYRPYRSLFDTPFWVEGWALYWEMLFWDQHFPKTPENKVGMLFWRMHRCARIIFSLSFHTKKMTPQQCIDFLVDRVGHERDNATAEVRRSFIGGYGPLYQAGYMLGGLQIRSLRHDLVDTGKMTNKQFHDAILKGNTITIEMVRASLANVPLTRDYKTNWRFYDLGQ